MDNLTSFMGRHGFMPHGYCFTWEPTLLWTMVSADALIALAYFSIPLALITFARRRQEPALNGLIGLFSAFIFACGLTHVMDIWTIWQPDYGLQAIFKVIAALVSVGTAALLWPLIPRALKIPSVQALQSAVHALEAEVVQRRQAEDSLRDTQEALIITLASIGAGFIATDRQGRITRMNAVAEQVTGWPVAQALGRAYGEVFQHEDQPPGEAGHNPVDALIAAHAASTPVSQVVAHEVVRSRQGALTALELKASLVYGPDHEARGLALVFRDMTLLNQAEAQANRLAAIVSSSQDAIVSKTLEGVITSWNQGAEQLFGYSAQEAIGQSVQMLIPPDRRHEEMVILAQLSQGVRVPPFETVRRHRDGRPIDVSVTISPLQDAQGRVVGAAKIARDISAQKLTEQWRIKGERLEAENRQIQEASRIKSEFLANMSHELRTPLNAIIGFADLLQTGAVPPTSPKHQAFLGHIGTSGRHLLQLINDVLDLSKVEAGKLGFHAEPVHLPALVREVCDILQTSASRHQITLHQELDPAVHELVLDPARLKQVLYNYLSNAIKFTPAGGPVTVRARAHGPAHVHIEVEDAGIGIPPDDLQRLFVAFQQLDSGLSRQHQGTGLGLALTRRLVQAQGGSVGVRSTPGVGSVFHLVLPRIVSQARLAEADEQGARVLVIEPNHDKQALIQSALSATGLHTDAATNGLEALQHAGQTTYSAITLDLLLPDRAGLELLSHIRQVDHPNHQASVVAVSMATSPQHSASFHVADVLSKPIDARQVAAALGKLGLPGGQPVMVIDDDPLALAVMQGTLQAMGVQAVCMADARQALAALPECQPAAIILDLMMPGMDGFAVLDALQHMPRWHRTPVFIWTSMLLTDEEYACLARSAQAIINKGGGALDALLDRLRTWRPHGSTALAGAPQEGGQA